MSTLKVAALQGLSASSDAITLANDGTCTANITNNLSNRNLVINGAFQVAQRGTSSTGSTYQTVDRFGIGTLQGAITQAQVDLTSSDTPYASGFRKAYKVTNSTANTSAGCIRDIRTTVEAQDMANSGWDSTNSSSKITLSFWVRSSVAQTYYCFYEIPDSTKHYVWSFALSANTWTKVTKTISGASGVTINNDNGAGLVFKIGIFFGTNYTTSGQAVDTWGAYSGSSRVPDMTSTWAGTTDATFEITGVQLEVGSVATDFEHRSYAVEKRLCQRYYQQYLNPRLRGVRGGNNTDFHRMGMTLLVEMRSDPTLSWSGTQNVYDGDHLASITGIGTGYPDPMSVEFEASVSGTLGTGTGSAIVAYTGGNEGTLMLSAEL